MLPLQNGNMDQLVVPDLSILEDKSPNLVCKTTKKRQRISNSRIQENSSKGEETNDRKIRQIMHRDTERQRRQEMASLYASLRSLLPLEYIKGKRAISDHMHQAVNYIKRMEKNLKDLRMRRDKLKNSSNSDVSESGGSNSLSLLSNCVTVSSCNDGIVEILISCGLKEQEEFPFSKLIKIILETGLDVFSCVSTKANEKFIYQIQTMVSELAYIDLPQLQERLYSVINFGSKIKHEENHDHLVYNRESQYFLNIEERC